MLGNRNTQGNDLSGKGNGIINDSLLSLATIIAIITAFLMSGIIHEYTAPWIYKFMYSTYDDDGLASFAMIVWDGLATFAVYQLAKIAYVLALIFIVTRVAFTFV